MAPSGTSASEFEKYQEILAQLDASDVQNPATQDALKALGLQDVPPLRHDAQPRSGRQVRCTWCGDRHGDRAVSA